MASDLRKKKAHCPYCGRPVYPTDDVCVSCGRELLPAAPVTGQPSAPLPAVADEGAASSGAGYVPVPPARSALSLPITGLALAGVVCGLTALLLFPVFLAPAAIILGALAIGKGDTRGGAVAVGTGVLCGVVGFLLGAVVWTAQASKARAVPPAQQASYGAPSNTLAPNVAGCVYYVFQDPNFFQGYVQPAYGYHFYAVGVVVSTDPASREAIDVNPLDFRAVCNGAEYSVDFGAGMDLNSHLPQLQAVTIQPGGQVQGFFAFQLPGPPEKLIWKPATLGDWTIAVEDYATAKGGG